MRIDLLPVAGVLALLAIVIALIVIGPLFRLRA
jgi:hypothetical protein